MHIKGRAGQPKIQWGEHQLWVGVEKSKVERDAAKRTNNALRIIKPLIHLTADQLSSVDYVEVDYRRCIIWIKQLRFCLRGMLLLHHGGFELRSCRNFVNLGWLRPRWMN